MSDCPLIITADPELLDQALTAVAAAGAEAMVVPDPAAARASWREASLVLLGIDQAEAFVRHPPRPHRSVHLLGDEHDREQLCSWSAQLSAAIAVLPEHRGALSVAIRDQHGATGRGGLTVVLGATGGVGASTLAAGLAWSAHASGKRCVLMDLDPYGGGLDLALGVESEPGWRWSQLARVSGQVSGLADRLPRMEGLAVLAADRQAPIEEPSAQAVHDVLASLRAEHDAVVVDLGRGISPATAFEVSSAAQRVLFLVRDDVRGVAAAESWLSTRPEETATWQVVVCRTTRTSGLPESEIGSALARDLAATLPYDRRLRLALLQGHPPATAATRGWRRSVSQLSQEIWP